MPGIPLVRVSNLCERGGEWTLFRLEVNMQLFKQAADRRVLQEDEFTLADHDLLMTIADVIRVVRPLLRGVRTHDVDRFDRFTHGDNRALRIEHQAVSTFQDRPGGEGDGKVDAAVGSTTSVSLPAIFKGERERVLTVRGKIRPGLFR